MMQRSKTTTTRQTGVACIGQDTLQVLAERRTVGPNRERSGHEENVARAGARVEVGTSGDPGVVDAVGRPHLSRAGPRVRGEEVE